VLTMDMAVSIDGWVADSARTVIVARRRRRTCDWSAPPRKPLKLASPWPTRGNRLGDISAAIQAVAEGYGYPINNEFGRPRPRPTMHEDRTCPTAAAPAGA